MNHRITWNLFLTITNANFDEDAIVARIKETLAEKEDIRSLRELITYGLKGLSAYSKHAGVLMEQDVQSTSITSWIWGTSAESLEY